ncbi:MAG: FAD-dependent oxidoreductase, partial [Pseudomonadota bacterium]
MSEKIAIIGAGIGGLASAMRLAHRGCDVTVLERHAHVGGKMRTMDSVAGPVDAGPTVMTLRPIFEELFAACDTRLADHVTLCPLEILARHRWSDGTILDLSADVATSEATIADAFGGDAAQAFAAFHGKARTLFQAFEAPMMQAANPRVLDIAGVVLRNPGVIPALLTGPTLSKALARDFAHPKLQQLFGRYATYVGGSPTAAPALLSLIWYAEAQGVWAVDGGMHKLAQAMATVAEKAGARIRLNTGVTAMAATGDGARLTLADGEILADKVIFNGDPKALFDGRLGPAPRR